MAEDKNEKSRSALLSKILSADISGTDTEDDDIPLARYSAGQLVQLSEIIFLTNIMAGLFLHFFLFADSESMFLDLLREREGTMGC